MKWFRRNDSQTQNRQSEPDGQSAFGDVLAELRTVRDVRLPDPAAVAESRRRLLRQAAGLRAARAGCPLRGSRRPALLALAALLILVIGSLGGLVVAAQSAWPATALYPLKLAWEDLRLALTSHPQSRVVLALELIEERVTEIEQLNAAGRPVPEMVLQRLELAMRQALQDTAQLSEPQMRECLHRLGETAEGRSQALGQALRSAPPQNRAAITQGITIMTGAQAWITMGLHDPQAFRDIGGSPLGFPALLPSTPTTTVAPKPRSTALPSPHPTSSPMPAPITTTPPAPTPAAPEPTPTAPPSTPPPSCTPGQRQSPIPQTPGPKHTPTTTRTSGSKHTSTSPAPSEPTPTQRPPQQTPHPTHGQRP